MLYFLNNTLKNFFNISLRYNKELTVLSTYTAGLFWYPISIQGINSAQFFFLDYRTSFLAHSLVFSWLSVCRRNFFLSAKLLAETKGRQFRTEIYKLKIKAQLSFQVSSIL